MNEENVVVSDITTRLHGQAQPSDVFATNDPIAGEWF
jgi:hypothetical protein